MKREVLLKKLDEMIIPDRLLVEDDKLKHSDRRTKSRIKEIIEMNLYVVFGMPAIDKEYEDEEINSLLLSLFENGIDDSIWESVIFSMIRLNAYTKTRIMNSKFKNEVYKLKKRIVRMLVKQAPQFIISTSMHVRFNEEIGEDEYFMQYTIQNLVRESMIHQPLRNVEKLYPAETITEMKANAVPYDNSEPVWEFERTDEERIQIEKMFSFLVLYVMILEKMFGIDNYFSK